MIDKNVHIRILNKFQYYLEDTSCIYCKHYISKKLGCKLRTCCCTTEKQEAITNNRIKRERGFFKWDM